MSNEYADIGVIADGKAVLSFTSNSASGTKKVSSPTTVKLHIKDKQVNIASWGANNLFPQDLLESVRKNGVATSGLSAVSDNHYGSGFILFKENFDKESGKRELIQQSFLQYPEIKTFFKTNSMKRFFLSTITDLEYFSIGFPEYCTTNDYNTITRVHRQKAAQCRFELMGGNKIIPRVWISSDWSKVKGDPKDSEYAEKVAFVSPFWTIDEVKAHLKKEKITKFIRPIFYAMLDENYYPVATWHSAYYSKWIEVANSIPEFKKALFENQSSIKYHIEVDEEYFQRKYKDTWDDKDDEEKIKIQKEFAEFLDKTLRGKENTAKSVFSSMYKDDEGKPVAGLKITPIDDKLKDGAFLPDGEVANKEILAAIGVDSTIISSGSVGGQGSGSGSDKRVAWNILSLRSKSKRETTLEVFDFIQQFNSWEETLVGAFEDSIITTLDKNPTGTTKTANA